MHLLSLFKALIQFRLDDNRMKYSYMTSTPKILHLQNVRQVNKYVYSAYDFRARHGPLTLLQSSSQT